MAGSKEKIEVYLEIGKKRVFAGALDWPGWSRSGRDEQSALQALLEHGPRYQQIVQKAAPELKAPVDLSALEVTERLEGGSTTDFGAPEIPPSVDSTPVTGKDLERFRSLLQAIWAAYDRAAEAAVGKELRKGPRGGGRELEKITAHVLGSEAAYLRQLGRKLKLDESAPLEEQLALVRQEALQALASPPAPDAPTTGPRGGKLWTQRYFVRRSAWHILDHAWEIENRIE